MKSIAQEWIEPQPVEISRELVEAAEGQILLARALARRGLSKPNQVRAFLDPNCYLSASPQELPDLARAVDRLQTAIENHERIGIWGDFDVDGQTATTLLYSSLKRLGASVYYHIPVRAVESHGVQPQKLIEFLKQGVQLLITCDTGVTAYDAVEICRQQGIDMLITDHHSLPPELPPALAVVNPQRLSEDHPLRPLCGVGCTWKMVEELYRRYGKIPELENDLDLVALGTIADLAELSRENRYLVQRGLKLLRETRRPALQAMLETAEIHSDFLSENHVSFVLAPRLNA
ncbi:MAG: DHH family phosphoesterase, partial [Anaerolineales bacterium]